MTPLKLKRSDIDMLIDGLNHRAAHFNSVKYMTDDGPERARIEIEKGDALIVRLEILRAGRQALAALAEKERNRQC